MIERLGLQRDCGLLNGLCDESDPLKGLLKEHTMVVWRGCAVWLLAGLAVVTLEKKGKELC